MTGFASYSQSIRVLRRLAVIRATTDKNALPDRICAKRMMIALKKSSNLFGETLMSAPSVSHRIDSTDKKGPLLFASV